MSNAARNKAAYTEEEDRLIREFWPDASRERILNALPGRTMKSIEYRAGVLKVRRSAAAVQKARKASSLLGNLSNKRKKKAPVYEGQIIVIRPAPARDGWLVRQAVAQSTPLEAAWRSR